ncbi:hypothetical protein [Emticicia sp. 17c]|uniref:hypothetical protein n=1 Tax=Emticicia sp. 17c TaxID=3127704 RepID=UPI00301C9F1B
MDKAKSDVKKTKSHIYFLVDTSRYMIGQPIRKVEELIRTSMMASDENLYYSIITFGNSLVKVYLPTTPVAETGLLQIQFGCSQERRLVACIDLIMTEVENETSTTHNQTQQSVFIFTGGFPEAEFTEKQLAFLRNDFQEDANKLVNVFLVLFDNDYLRKRYSLFFREEQILNIENISQIKEVHDSISKIF